MPAKSNPVQNLITAAQATLNFLMDLDERYPIPSEEVEKYYDPLSKAVEDVKGEDDYRHNLRMLVKLAKEYSTTPERTREEWCENNLDALSQLGEMFYGEYE